MLFGVFQSIGRQFEVIDTAWIFAIVFQLPIDIETVQSLLINGAKERNLVRFFLFQHQREWTVQISRSIPAGPLPVGF